MSEKSTIATVAELEALYGDVPVAAVRKQANHLHPVYRRWIEASPFAVIATVGPSGLDASPRGDPDCVVRIVDERTLWIPDRPGNNRIDSLRNLMHDPMIALLFFVPGVNETVRVVGTAVVTIDDAVLDACAMEGKRPRCVIVMRVEEVFFQCGRAVKRSALWTRADARQVPTAGDMLAAVTHGEVGGAAYDAALPERQNRTLY